MRTNGSHAKCANHTTTALLKMRWLFVVILSFCAQAQALTLSWTNNFLIVSGENIPGKTLRILYIEAFCRSGSTDRDWGQTVIPHKTKLLATSDNGKHLFFLTTAENIEAKHEVRAGNDEVSFVWTIRNISDKSVDLDWFQPTCIEVDKFTSRGQTNYWPRCFIFTTNGLTTLDKTHRTEQARYRGGQVYVPKGTDLKSVNLRPISPDQPTNNVIGCFSADNQWLLASAWDKTHELFQGVRVCVHGDPHIGGLKPHETKTVHGKIYILKNDPTELLRRYNRDFNSPSPANGR
jgi:hypothetical protein